MDLPSIIVGAIVAGGPVAQGVGVPVPVVEQVVDTARTDLPALTEQLPDLQPYVDQAVAAVEELQAAVPPEVTTQIGDRIPPAAKDEIAGVQAQLPAEVQGVIPPGFLPPPAPAPPEDGVVAAGSVAPPAPVAQTTFVPPPATSTPSALSLLSGTGGTAVPTAFIPGLTVQGIPVVFLPALDRAASVCGPKFPKPVAAAQLWVENRFRYGPSAPVSSARAMGPAQFMPQTWAQWGRDYSGDGVADPNDVTDAVMSQAHLMCWLIDEVDRGKADGSLEGDTLALALAAFNAGLSALVRHPSVGDSMPSGGDYTTETGPYVAKILATAPRFATMLGLADPAVVQRYGSGVVAAALAAVGTPYVWGATGPDAFDCSGLTRFTYAAGRQIVLPRTSQEQYAVGQQISADQIQPGDLLFEDFRSDGPHHVAISLGADAMVEAPQPGQHVRISPVRPGMVAVRY